MVSTHGEWIVQMTQINGIICIQCQNQQHCIPLVLLRHSKHHQMIFVITIKLQWHPKRQIQHHAISFLHLLNSLILFIVSPNFAAQKVSLFLIYLPNCLLLLIFSYLDHYNNSLWYFSSHQNYNDIPNNKTKSIFT